MEDFRKLLEGSSSRGPIASLLARWFGCSVEGEDGDVWVLNDRGEALDLLWLHLRIQNDPVRRGEFYFTKMDLWK